MQQIARIADELGHSIFNVLEDQFGFSVSLRTRDGQTIVVRVPLSSSDLEIRKRLSFS